VTVAPLKPYVDEVLRGHGESQSLLRPGQGAHDFALAPTQAAMLNDADIVIVPDLDMSPMLKRLLAKKKNVTVIELSSLEGANPMPYPEANPWLDALKTKEAKEAPKHHEDNHDHAHHGDDKKPINDPHLWLDPERMAAISLHLAHAIAEASPEARPTLDHNARQLSVHLRNEVIPALRTLLDRTPRTLDAVGKDQIPFITYHAAYQYFLSRFGLTHHGEITKRPQEMRGAKTSAAVLRGAENIRVRCLIGEEKNNLMQRIATLTEARIIILSPEQLVDRKDLDALDWIKSDYDRFIYKTAKTFANCL